MENKEKKSKLKEVLKAAGVTGAGAAIGAAALPTNALSGPLEALAYSDSPIGDSLWHSIIGGHSDTVVDRNPKLGVGLNAAASGLGALAAYGVLRGLSHNKHKKELELARAYGESAKSGRA